MPPFRSCKKMVIKLLHIDSYMVVAFEDETGKTFDSFPNFFMNWDARILQTHKNGLV